MKNYKKIPSEEKERVLNIINLYGLNSAKIYRNTVAFVNKVYLVDDGSKKYILRESRPTTDKNHILLETELISFLNKKNFSLAPKILPNENGEIITEKNGLLYILQSFLPGETIGNWDNLSKFDLKKCKEFFSTSALFARAVQGFKTTVNVKNLEVSDYVENSLNSISNAINNVSKSKGRDLLDKSVEKIRLFLEDTYKEFNNVNYRKLPKQIVHFDFHPGNVNFDGNKVTGIFDYDWIRFDSRITDIASTICQSCYFYGGPKGGSYRKDRIQTGLEFYRKTYGKSEFNKQQENNLIRVALKGYLVFQLLFCIEDYTNNINSKRHFVALDQFIKLVTINDYNYLFS